MGELASRIEYHMTGPRFQSARCGSSPFTIASSQAAWVASLLARSSVAVEGLSSAVGRPNSFSQSWWRGAPFASVPP